MDVAALVLGIIAFLPFIGSIAFLPGLLCFFSGLIALIIKLKKELKAMAIVSIIL